MRGRLSKSQSTFKLFRAGEREFSTTKAGNDEIKEQVVARPFEEIPGPKGLPLLGTLHKYLPIIGEYDPKRLYKIGAAKYAEYGPLVREEIVAGEPIVFVFRPEDVAEVFRADSEAGRHPERRSHVALLKYRRDRGHVYNTGGLLPTNGPEWWRLRKEFQKEISKPANVLKYLSDVDKAAREFADLCGNNRFDDDALPLLSRLFLRLTCLVAFDLDIDVYSDEEMKPDSMSSKLIDAAFVTNDVIYPLDNGPMLWRYFNTPKYKMLINAQSYMEKIAIQMVSEKADKLKAGGTAGSDKESLLEIYLRNPALDQKDVVGMACDMLLAGIDTTAYTSAYALYHLANNPEVQAKLRDEASKLLPNEKDAVTADVLREAQYTKAVLKETFRLNPISVGVGRILQTDLVLNGYLVRKGTNVVTQNQVSCRLPEYFEKPDSFIPERWLRDATTGKKASIHPYLVVPFGHGPRSCIARRLAEQNMQILLLRMSRNLEFYWEGGDLDIISTPINKPNVPIKLRFQQRSSSKMKSK